LPDFFENLPTERLLGEGVLPEYLNDGVFGRILDKIYECGATELFNRIILRAMKRIPINPRICHIDTINFSVYGDDENDNDGKTINITYGYPKDKRVDVLRFSISMVTDQKGIPLFLRALDGNSSDKKALIETIRELTQNLNLDDKVYHVADSAFYTEDNVKEIGNSAFLILKVPAVINEVNKLLFADLMMETCSDERYSFLFQNPVMGELISYGLYSVQRKCKREKRKRLTRRFLRI
jgi:transposase